jgi:hypothetical protein
MRTKYLLLSAALLSTVLADAAAAYDPPSRVARLAYLHGAVSHAPAGVDDWAMASLNRPVVTGDRIWTEPGARDELQIGNAAIRMDGATLLSVLNLDDQAMQVQLTQGTLNIRVRPGRSAGVIEVDTPNLALTIQRPGHYRVTVDPSGQTTLVRVADGQAQVYGPANSYLVGPNQAYRFAGNDLRDMQFADANRRDAFDRWSAERDRRAERSVAARYVSPALVGYEDLDDYGSWRRVEGYGPVWTPRRVARDWAPYRDGHWAWVAPWGWTWVDDAPWGFAVSHYGRWANFGGNWGWVPGPAAAQPVYAPALVMFVGASASPRRDYGPSVGWFPLAPREVYRPPYPASQRYVTNINVTNTVINQVQVTNVYNNPRSVGDNYQNRRIAGATTAVPANVFAGAQPVRRAARAMPPDVLAGATLAAAAPVQAQRESLASHYAGGHRPAPAALARRVMVHANPATAQAQAAAARGPVPAVPAIARQQRMPAPVPSPGPGYQHDPRMAAQPVPAPQGATGAPEHGREMGHGRRDVPVMPVPMPGAAPTDAAGRAIAAHGGATVAMPGASPHQGWRPGRGAEGTQVAPQVTPQVQPPAVDTGRMHGPRTRENEAAPLAQQPTQSAPAHAVMPPPIAPAAVQDQRHGHGNGAGFRGRFGNATVSPMPTPITPIPGDPVPAGRVPPQVVPPQVAGHEQPRDAGHGRHQRPEPAPVQSAQAQPQVVPPQPAPRAELPHPQPTPMPAPQAQGPRHEPHQERPHAQPAQAPQAQAAAPHAEPQRERPRPPVAAPQAQAPRHEQHREPPHAQPAPAPQPQVQPPHPEPQRERQHPEPHREAPHPQPAPPSPAQHAAPPSPQPAPPQHEKGGEHHGNGHKDKDGK